MQKFLVTAASALSLFITSQSVHAQSNAGVDASCMMKDASGQDTVDMKKCPDGKTPGSAATMKSDQPAGTDTSAAGTATDPNATAAGTAGTATDPNAPAAGTATTVDPNAPATTASTSPSTDLIVPQESLANATIMSANDFIGKRVYTKNNEDIGEVNDIIMTDNGNVRAVILGVGGFLGMGEKDVAVSMNSINVSQDGNSTKLIVDATKDQLTAAPKYDRAKRTYVQ